MKPRILLAVILLSLALILIPWTATEYRAEHTVTVTADGTQIPSVPCGSERYLAVQTVDELADPTAAVRSKPPRDVTAGGVLRTYLNGQPVPAEGTAICADGTAEQLKQAEDGLLLPAGEGKYTVVLCTQDGRDRYYAAVSVRCILPETVFY